jgi:hypothetical protein
MVHCASVRSRDSLRHSLIDGSSVGNDLLASSIRQLDESGRGATHGGSAILRFITSRHFSCSVGARRKGRSDGSVGYLAGPAIP